MSSRAPMAAGPPGIMSPPPARRATCARADARRTRRACTSGATRSGRPAGSYRSMAADSRPIISTKAGGIISTGTSNSTRDAREALPLDPLAADEPGEHDDADQHAEADDA